MTLWSMLGLAACATKPATNGPRGAGPEPTIALEAHSAASGVASVGRADLSPAPSAPSAPSAAAAPSALPADGSAGAATAAAAGDRVYSKVRFLWVRPQPGPTQSWIGYLSLGDSVRVRGGKAQAARIADAAPDSPTCQAWYAIEPKGYLCVGDEATLDPNDPLIVELRKSAADRRSPWPYQYGESTGTPVYPSVPDAATQAQNEPDVAGHLARLAKAQAARTPEDLARIDPDLVGVPLDATGLAPPPNVPLHPLGRALRPSVARGSTLAFTRSFDAAGRSWLLTWDWGVVPRDRVRPYPVSHFSGVELTGGKALPLAFFRTKPRAKYRRATDHRVEPTGETWPRQGWVELTGQAVESGNVRYLETKEQGLLCAEQDATIVVQSTPTPATITERTQGRRTWIEVSVLGGWLIAYEAEQPVFATLISPGRGGIPFPGIPPINTASTPLGQFTVTGKFLTATMVSSSDSNIVHAEVQYTQNFSGPHTLHGAYWHDDWGERKSGGCVNLSPHDAQRVFEWTDPALPEGWHAVRWIPGATESTVVVIHR